MQDNRINYVLIGGFVAAMITALVVTLAVLSGRGSDTDTYFTVYDNVSGIKFGTQVMYEGYQIGQVESIEPIWIGEQVKFRVEITVAEDWIIPVDSTAKATMSGLLSAITIDIRGGTSAQRLQPGMQIAGESAGNLFAAMESVAATVGDLSENHIKPMLESLTEITNTVHGLVSEQGPEIMGNVARITQDLSQKIPEISASVALLTNRLDKELLTEANTTALSKTVTNFERTSADIASFSAGLNEMRGDIQKMVGTLSEMIERNGPNVDDSVSDMRYTLSTLARSVDAITYNLDATARNFAEFSRTIRQNPGLLLSGGDPVEDSDGGGQ